MPHIKRTLAALAGLFVIALWTGPAAAERLTTEEALSDRVLGDPNAPVTILDYSSLTCPHCASFHAETLGKLKEQFIDTGKARLVYRDFAVDGAALRAAMLARCAPRQRYFGMLEVLFKSQGQWSHAADPVAALTRIGRLAGMGEDDIKSCLADQALMDGILKMRLEADRKYQVEATPTFIFNEGAARISGNQPLDEFARTINKLAAK